MKKIQFILILVFLLGNFAVGAQNDENCDRIDRLKSQKVAFLTERIGLSSSEAQKFWPVYNDFSSKMDSLWHLKKSNIKNLYNSLESFSQKEREVAIDLHVDLELQKAQLEKEYHKKFKKVLTIDQIIKLYSAEHEFKKKMLHLIKGGKPSSCVESEYKPEDTV